MSHQNHNVTKLGDNRFHLRSCMLKNRLQVFVRVQRLTDNTYQRMAAYLLTSYRQDRQDCQTLDK